MRVEIDVQGMVERFLRLPDGASVAAYERVVAESQRKGWEAFVRACWEAAAALRQGDQYRGVARMMRATLKGARMEEANIVEVDDGTT